MASIVGQIKAILSIDKTKFDKGLKGAEKSTNKFGSAVKKLGGVLAGAFAITKIVQWGKALLGATDKQAKAEQSLLVALKGRKDIQQSLIKQSQKLQEKTLFGDEQTIDAAAKLAMLLGQDEKAISKLLPLVQDLATSKFGGNLATAADMVAKSVGSSTNALSRYGIEITGAVGSSERLESAVRGMNSQVGGQAEAAAKVGTGALTQLINIWGDYKEYLGSKLLPVMNKVAEWGKNFITNLAPKQSEALRIEKREVNRLVDAITNENTSREVRKTLIDELQRKYPGFLGNLDKEKVTNGQLLTKLQDVNKEYENKIKLALQEELIKKQAGPLIKSGEKEIKLLNKIGVLERYIAKNKDFLGEKEKKYREKQISDLEELIKKEQEYREELRKHNEAVLALFETTKKAGATAAGAGAGGAGGSGDIERIAGPAKITTFPTAAIDGLREMSSALADCTIKTKEFYDEYTNGGLAAIEISGGLADVISQSFTATGNILENFGKFFIDFIKGMIGRLIAAAVAALALAVAISLIPGLGAGMGGKMAKAINFMSLFKAGFGAMSGLGEGFASGGVVPGGYPNDTYPALLSSNERVLTPSQNRDYESGAKAMKIAVGGNIRIAGSDLLLSLTRAIDDRNTNT